MPNALIHLEVRLKGGKGIAPKSEPDSSPSKRQKHSKTKKHNKSLKGGNVKTTSINPQPILKLVTHSGGPYQASYQKFLDNTNNLMEIRSPTQFGGKKNQVIIPQFLGMQIQGSNAYGSGNNSIFSNTNKYLMESHSNSLYDNEVNQLVKN